MVVKPSERRNQAARYLNVFLSFLISEGRSIPPRRFQALMISRVMLHCSSDICGTAGSSPHSEESTSFIEEVLGNQSADGIEKRAHQIPLDPIARRNEKVEPPSFVTGMRLRMSRMIPAPYPMAIPRAEMREVAVESVELYSAWCFKLSAPSVSLSCPESKGC